jgi:acetyl-CoA carboxylase carboxyl transferase subunit alpha
MNDPRDFERPILEVEEQIENLRLFGESKAGEMRAAEAKLKKVRREVFSKLTPWQVVQVARHPRRPHTLDYLGAFIQDFVELHGDRRFGEDPAMVVGVGKFRERPVCVIGQQKGRDTKQKVFRNFGMPRPEGYRKALRVMRMAETHPAPIPGWTPRSAARPRPSPTTWRSCPGCGSPSWSPSSARGGAEGRSPSEWAIA